MISCLFIPEQKGLNFLQLDPLETSDCGTQLSGAEEPATQLLLGWWVGLAGGSFTWQGWKGQLTHGVLSLLDGIIAW